jgi:hypothetical protein
LEWDGKYFAIGAGYIYRISLIHGQAYYVGMTTLERSDIEGAFWFYDSKPGAQATEVVAGATSDSSSTVNFWDYPSGGYTVYSLTHGVYKPTGVTISLRTN